MVEETPVLRGSSVGVGGDGRELGELYPTQQAEVHSTVCSYEGSDRPAGHSYSAGGPGAR